MQDKRNLQRHRWDIARANYSYHLKLIGRISGFQEDVKLVGISKNI
jgi:hypothetical protein